MITSLLIPVWIAVKPMFEFSNLTMCAETKLLK